MLCVLVYALGSTVAMGQAASDRSVVDETELSSSSTTDSTAGLHTDLLGPALYELVPSLRPCFLDDADEGMWMMRFRYARETGKISGIEVLREPSLRRAPKRMTHCVDVIASGWSVPSGVDIDGGIWHVIVPMPAAVP